MVAPALLGALYGQAALYGQTPGARGKVEFEAASIRLNPPQAGFHMASDASSGGPGTSDPGMFRCSNCTLATLIVKAFELKNYQFPGRTALAGNTFDVMARVPAGTTREEFQAMLQNLLRDRFALTFHFTQKEMRGYNLVIAAKGSKLKESSDSAAPAAAGDANGHSWNGSGAPNRFGQGEAHAHSGPVSFNGNSSFRRDHQTTAELAQMLSDQISLPVEDQTGLRGKYDIALNWSGSTADSGSHTDGAFGGAGHDHGGPGAASGGDSRSADAAAPGLFDALQAQLGLKLVSSTRAAARIFVVDSVHPLPTEN